MNTTQRKSVKKTSQKNIYNLGKYLRKDSLLWLLIVMIGKKYGKEEFLKSSLSPMSAVGFCENVEYNVWKYLMRQGHNYLIQLKVQIQMV